MKTIYEITKIMKAYYEENKDIQFKDIDIEDDNVGWQDIDDPGFDWTLWDYRVKPESIIRPMTFEEIVDYWKNHRNEIFSNKTGSDIVNNFLIVGFHSYRCSNGELVQMIYTCNGLYTYEDFIRDVIKEDGSKFEVEDEKK